MHAVDPTIKLGAVAVDGEDAYGTGLNPVPNPNENNALHSGWTPVVLATMAVESMYDAMPDTAATYQGRGLVRGSAVLLMDAPPLGSRAA